MATAAPLDRPSLRLDRSASSASDLDAMARWMDSAFVIPGTRFRFGLDPLLGLLPGLGDAATAAASLYILSRARQLGASRATIVRMAINLIVDAVFGALPLVGDIFDAYWKANLRNVELVRRHALAPANDAQRLRRADRIFVALTVVLVGLVLAASAVGTVFVVAMAFDVVTNAWN